MIDFLLVCKYFCTIEYAFVRQRESKYQPRVYPLVSLRRSNWNGRQSSCTTRTCARETKKEKVAIRGREIITRHVSIGRDDDAYEQHEHR